jgi:hypothetical protein
MARPLFISLCCLGALVAGSCSPLPLIQDASVVRKGKLKVGVGAFMSMPIEAKTYMEPDGPGAKGSVDNDLQYMPLIHAAGWTRYGFAEDLEFTTAFHVPTFAIAIGLKWAAIAYEPGDVASLALSGEVGGSFVIMSYVIGVGFITSFHLSEEVSLDLGARFGTMTGLWNGPALTSTIGLSFGRKSTLRFAAGYATGFGDQLGPSAPALFFGGGWEY